MCEFNQQNRLPSQPVSQLQSISSDNAYERALSKIKQLEGELQQKERVLNNHLKEQVKMGERLQACIQTLQKTSKQLTSAKIHLQTDYQQMLDRIAALEQENSALECSNSVWTKRSIALEFDKLTTQDELKAIKAEHDLAITMIALLEMELIAWKTAT